MNITKLQGVNFCKKLESGGKIAMDEAIAAKCAECFGFETSKDAVCTSYTCPLRRYSQYVTQDMAQK